MRLVGCLFRFKRSCWTAWPEVPGRVYYQRQRLVGGPAAGEHRGDEGSAEGAEAAEEAQAVPTQGPCLEAPHRVGDTQLPAPQTAHSRRHEGHVPSTGGERERSQSKSAPS